MFVVGAVLVLMLQRIVDSSKLSRLRQNILSFDPIATNNRIFMKYHSHSLKSMSWLLCWKFYYQWSYSRCKILEISTPNTSSSVNSCLHRRTLRLHALGIFSQSSYSCRQKKVVSVQTIKPLLLSKGLEMSFKRNFSRNFFQLIFNQKREING